MDAMYALSGFLVGLIVGVTGVGGGSLMTPLLVLFFGIAPATAVCLANQIVSRLGTCKARHRRLENCGFVELGQLACCGTDYLHNKISGVG
jgi:uncharacterized membrane protein YfcA